MKAMLFKFFRSRFLLANFLFSLLVNLMAWALIYWRIRPSAEPIPLHYNIYFGLDLIGPWQQAFIIPAVGLAIFLLNFVLAWWLHQHEKALGHLLMGMTSVLQIFLLIGGVMLVLINI